MQQVIAVQHTQSVHHLNGMVGSWTDWELTELGKRHAQNLAGNLAAELAGKSMKLYSSDLLRARQTAAPLADRLGVAAEYRKELREQNLGEAVGKSTAWLRERLTPERTVDDRLLPDAESRREVWNRLLPISREILGRPEEVVLLVSHGTTLAIWNSLWLNLRPEDLERGVICGATGGVSFFDRRDDGQRRIRRVGDLSYRAEPRESKE